MFLAILYKCKHGEAESHEDSKQRCSLKLMGPKAKFVAKPSIYHLPFIVLVSSYLAEGLWAPLRHQGLGATFTSVSHIATPLSVCISI